MNYCNIHQQSYHSSCYKCVTVNYTTTWTSSTPTKLELDERQNSYEAGYITGLTDERERIIAILDNYWTTECGDIIDLIKGENK